MDWRLINERSSFRQFWRLGAYGQSTSSSVSSEAHVLVLRQGALGVSSIIRARIPCRWAPPLWPDHFPKASPSNHHTGGIGFNMWNFRRHKYSLYSTSQAWSYKWRTEALRGVLAFSRLEGLGKTQDSPVPGPSKLCFCRLQREPVSVRTLLG